MTVDPNAFKAVMGRFATGVTVVTTCDGPQRFGITANAFTSVSLDPPLVLVCIERASRVHPILLRSCYFAVNFLSEDQRALAVCFAGSSEDRYARFCGVSSHTEATGAPVFDDCLAFVDCRIVDIYPGGDHDIILGQVEALGGTERRPLLYHRRDYPRLSEDRR